MKKLLGLVVILSILLGGVYYSSEVYLAKTVGRDTLIEINKGASLSSVARQLSQEKLIVYPRIFVKLGQYYGFSDKLKFGEYKVTTETNYRELFKIITSGKSFKYSVTLVEGDHMYKYARQLEEKGLCKASEFLRLAKDPKTINALLGKKIKSLEGYLFPDTYQFAKSDGAKTIIKTMVKKFLAETNKLNFTAVGLTRHQAVTLASIIEKETGAAFERPMISSVFYNRMKKNMRLQTDPTIIYGILDATGKEIRNIRTKDINGKTAYNTYVIKGLPPGPIANPGRDSLRAAVNPDKTPYLYFVSKNNGTHVFTTNYKDHRAAVKKFQLNAKARKGKSWRDLKSNKGNK